MKSDRGEVNWDGAACPAPLRNHKQIVLGHGSGGKLTAELVSHLFLPAFQNEYLSRLDDQAVLQLNGVRLAFTTDSFIVTPIFFPAAISAAWPSMAPSTIWP